MPSPLDLIDTVVIAILENRSFDQMLGFLNLPGTGRIELEGLQADPQPITLSTAGPRSRLKNRCVRMHLTKSPGITSKRAP